MSTPSDRPTPPANPDHIDYREAGDITEVHAAIQREHVEPTAKVTPIPLWLTAVCGAAMVWAGIYFGIFNGGLSGNVFNEYESSPALLFPPPTTSKGAGVTAEAPQSMAQIGKGVYSNCVACHQASGMGVPGQFPVLAGSEWVTGGEKRLLAIMLKGVTGPMTIAGKPGSYTGNMVGWETSLSSKKIAAVVSYIRSEWGNGAPEVTEADVEMAKKEFAAQKTQWTEAQLLQIPDENYDGAGPASAAPAPAAAKPATPAVAAAVTPAGAAPAAPKSSGAPSAPPPAGPAPGVALKAEAAAPTAAASPEQMALGKTVYMTVCVACHQPNGAGLPMVFPPITKSKYVMDSAERLAAIILKGNAGPFTIEGKPYNNIMVPQEAMLDDTKIAAVMTYVRANFGNTAGPVTPELVAATRKKFADRKTPWTQAELDAWKDDAAPGAAVPPAPTTQPPAAAPAPAAPAPVPAAPAPASNPTPPANQ
jgi:mono/diheme cytochrome c family protein